MGTASCLYTHVKVVGRWTDGPLEYSHDRPTPLCRIHTPSGALLALVRCIAALNHCRSLACALARAPLTFLTDGVNERRRPLGKSECVADHCKRRSRIYLEKGVSHFPLFSLLAFPRSARPPIPPRNHLFYYYRSCLSGRSNFIISRLRTPAQPFPPLSAPTSNYHRILTPRNHFSHNALHSNLNSTSHCLALLQLFTRPRSPRPSPHSRSYRRSNAINVSQLT